MLRASTKLEELIYESTNGIRPEFDIKRVIFVLPKLRTLLPRFGITDDEPCDLLETVNACPLFKVYGQRISTLGDFLCGKKFGDECKKTMTEFAKKASKLDHLEKLKIGMSRCREDRLTYFEGAKAIFKIFRDIRSITKLKVIRFAPSHGYYPYARVADTKEQILHYPY
ncbi:hypothetical protein EJ02DRAFT_428960 [Clathrospora elynae]|uniref:Uncharacterized protein n=1 Tax=Clathrospora elynae TaxID=706981 RepID=A0A6A5S5V2_9PLEO|nr:hypothetical protein EJ02DRAFT_428960 [Clathrospora elynae]